MKLFIRRLIQLSTLASACLFTVSQAATTTMVFKIPADYCMSQNEWRGGLSHATFQHHLLIAESDLETSKDIFVGFRLKSKPGALWLSNGTSWFAYEAGANPTSFIPFLIDPLRLLMIIDLEIIPEPVDLSALVGDGELLVGYGLRNNTTDTAKESFQEMINHQRFSVVWKIGAQPKYLAICLNSTGMTLMDEFSGGSIAGQAAIPAANSGSTP